MVILRHKIKLILKSVINACDPLVIIVIILHIAILGLKPQAHSKKLSNSVETIKITLL